MQPVESAMGPWLVTQNDDQFQVSDLEELRQLASDGKLTGGDMVQAPGSSEWQYASEVPEIASVLTDTLATDDDDFEYTRRSGGIVTALAVVGLLGVIAVGAGAAAFFWQMMPSESASAAAADSQSYRQLLVTEDHAPLRSDASASAPILMELDKDSRVELEAKRGDWYRAVAANGTEGWVATDHVIPAYLLAGGDAVRDVDPLFNPDHYVTVGNASWLQLDQDNTQLTVFRFLLQNDSAFPMTDVVLLATIKDPRGNELERVEIAVEGEIPPNGSTMVGTLAPEAGAGEDAPKRLLTAYTFEQMAAADPDLQLRYSDGVEVEMTATEFTEANIDLLEIRARDTTEG